MSNGNGRASAPSFGADRFADTLDSFIEDCGGVLDGLIALRDLGWEADQAVEEVMAIPTVRRMRLAWELWEAMAQGEGYDPEALIYEHVSHDVIERCTRALWDGEPEGRLLRLVRPDDELEY